MEFVFNTSNASRCNPCRILHRACNKNSPCDSCMRRGRPEECIPAKNFKTGAGYLEDTSSSFQYMNVLDAGDPNFMDESNLPEEPSHTEDIYCRISFDDQIFSHDLLSASSLAQLRQTLPSTAVIEILKREFFCHVEPYVLYPHEFEAEFERRMGGIEPLSPGWMALLFAVLSFGCILSAKQKSDLDITLESLSFQYDYIACRCVALDKADLWGSLRALIVLLYLRTGFSHQDVRLLRLAQHLALAHSFHYPYEYERNTRIHFDLRLLENVMGVRRNE